MLYYVFLICRISHQTIFLTNLNIRDYVSITASSSSNSSSSSSSSSSNVVVSCCLVSIITGLHLSYRVVFSGHSG